MKNIRILSLMLILTFSFQAIWAQNAEISPKRKKAIDSLALEKVRDLGNYIAIIGNKDTEWSEANRVIARAVELFMEGSVMEISILGKKKITERPVKEYLENLMRLNYDRVEIEWFDIQYVSDLVRQPDGRYMGVITIFQKFTAYDKEKGLVYKDVTKKDITIYVERKQTQISGRTIEFWDVLLGDIRVKETKKG